MSSRRFKKKPSAARELARPSPEPLDASGKRGSAEPASRLRRWSFGLIAVLIIPALCLGVAETILYALGTGYPASFLQPIAERPGYVADNYRFAWRFFPHSLARSSQPMVLAKQKPRDVTRVVVFGGSAAMGDPEPAFGLPRMLEVLLKRRYPGRDFEVINAAVTAVNSHVVLPIAKDCRALDADAWVFYLGNNEVVGPFGAGTVFGGRDTPLWLIRSSLALQRTKIGQLLSQSLSRRKTGVPQSWGALEMFLDHQLPHDDPALLRVYESFASNLEDMLDLAADRDIPAVISTVVTNLRSCAPFASAHGRSITSEELEPWRELFQRGCLAQSEKRYEQAIDSFQRAGQVDDEFAEAQYRLARCLLQFGDPNRAEDHFHKARDLDTLRFRADSTINEIITSAASRRSETNLRLVDADGLFAANSPGGVVGEELLWEHVHFNFAGNYLLARQIADELVAMLHLTDDGSAGDAWPTERECADRLGWTPYHRYFLLQEMRVRLRSAPFDGQFDHQARMAALESELSRLAATLSGNVKQASIEMYEKLIRDNPDDWYLREQFGALLEHTNDLDRATTQWIEITQQLPLYSVGFYKLGTLYNRDKQWKKAEQALRTALRLRPEYARASSSLGIALSHQGRFDESYVEFEKAVRHDPTFAEAYENWGLVLANQGETEESFGRFHDALRADEDYLPAHVRLGKLYVSRQRYEQAEPHYRAVARLKPNELAAHLNLGLLYVKMKQPAKAVTPLERAMQLDPSNRIAQQALAESR